MKKKIFLLLLPLTLAMVSCGKDVDAKVDKVDLARLLNSEEISEALEKVKDNYANKLSKCEMNAAYLSDDLVNQKREVNGSQTITIKGDEYAESKSEATTKVTQDFYSYSNKAIENKKVAAFGDYYLSYSESYNDGQTENKQERLNYSDKNSKSISEAIFALPFDESDIDQATIGVDKKDNMYAVYYRETIDTKEGHDQNGKDCTFKEKTTYEVSAKFGNLKDPKIESYKIVSKVEANYDKELKIYNKYQVLQSYVTSYKYEYKSRGSNDGKDSFISSLPNESVQGISFRWLAYEDYYGDGSYYGQTSDYANISSSKKDFSSGSLTAKTTLSFSKNYGYTFSGSASILKIDKSAKTIAVEQKNYQDISYNGLSSFDKKTVTINATTMELYFLKQDISSITCEFTLVYTPTTLTVSVVNK